VSIRVDAGAEEAEGDVSRGDLDPFFETDDAVDRDSCDVIAGDGVVDSGPGVRVCGLMGDVVELID
jgi:hypothetical protein